MERKSSASYAIQSVENALSLLEAIGEEALEEISVSRLSESLGLTKSKVFRLMATFEKRGYVENAATGGKYRLGPAAYETGRKFLLGMDLLRTAKPAMARLARECGEAIYLGVARGQDLLLLDMVNTSRQVAIIPLVGKSYPLAATAAGRVVLAAAGEKVRGSRLDLEEIRQRGFDVDLDALGDGIRSLAVPLYEGGGKVAGCLCMVAPSFRVEQQEAVEQMFPRLRRAGEVLSFALGHRECPSKGGSIT